MSKSEVSVSSSGRIAALLAASLFVGCMSTGGKEETVAALAERLVENLRVRADPRSVQVLVGEIHQNPGVAEESKREEFSHDTSATGGNGHDEDDLVGLELEHAVVVELSLRLNVVEAEHAGSLDVNAPESEPMALARELGATHILVGDYIPKEGRLIVALRLIDLQTVLITTAVRGWVSQADLGSPLD